MGTEIVIVVDVLHLELLAYQISMFSAANTSYVRLRNMLKIHHRASFARHFLKPSFSSCCFHVGILFILAAFGICS